MTPSISRESFIDYLEDYKKYLRRLRSEQDGADTSVYEISGALRAVGYLLKEVKKGSV